jgi:hypothetical protein
MRTSTLAALVTVALALAVPSAVRAIETRVFYAVLSGSQEVPPNDSTAQGTLTGGLNDDDTFSYSVTSTGFATPFRAAHVHMAPAGVAGPIIFPIACNAEGTSCSGVSRPLSSAERDLLASGGTYVNLHSEALPGGEIRGQLTSVAAAPPRREGAIAKFQGKASSVSVAPQPGSNRGAEIRITGRFSVEGAVDLRSSTAVIGDLLDEVGGAGELVRGRSGEPAIPTPLVLTRLKVKNRGRGMFDFTLECKRPDGATIPSPPQLCSGGPRPATTLRTRFVLNNVGETVRVAVVQPWNCVVKGGTVRELKAVEIKRGSSTPGSTPTGENRPPKADFRANPRYGPTPLTVVFENRSADPDGEALTYAWDFGDGSTSTERNPTHTYVEPGEFEVRLVITDARGATSTVKRDNVNAYPPAS